MYKIILLSTSTKQFPGKNLGSFFDAKYLFLSIKKLKMSDYLYFSSFYTNTCSTLDIKWRSSTDMAH